MKWSLKEVKEIENHIKTTTSCQHPPLEEIIVTGLQEYQRSTPLLMACKYGDLEAVKLIVEGWGINVCTPAVHCAVSPDRRLEGVTPLFIAAMQFHSKIVRYLVEKGASVSSRVQATDKGISGATSLLGAIYGNPDSDCEEKISIIRFLLESGADPSALTDDGVPISLSDLNVQVTTLLVEWGIDLSQRDPDSGFTMLHLWAGSFTDSPEDRSLSVVKMLLNHGADLQARDNYGFSVILAAANGDDKLPQLNVLDYLLERDDISRMDKIDTLEIAGAIILGNDGNHDKFPLAFQYWRRALTLRLMDTDESRPINKKPMKSKSDQLSEWSTLEDLQAMEQLPVQREVQSL